MTKEAHVLGPVSTRKHMWRLRHLLDGNRICPAHRREAIAERGAEGGRAVKHKVGGPGLDPDRLLDLQSHLNGGRLITGPSYPSVTDAFAVG